MLLPSLRPAGYGSILEALYSTGAAHPVGDQSATATEIKVGHVAPASAPMTSFLHVLLGDSSSTFARAAAELKHADAEATGVAVVVFLLFIIVMVLTVGKRTLEDFVQDFRFVTDSFTADPEVLEYWRKRFQPGAYCILPVDVVERRDRPCVLEDADQNAASASRVRSGSGSNVNFVPTTVVCRDQEQSPTTTSSSAPLLDHGNKQAVSYLEILFGPARSSVDLSRYRQIDLGSLFSSLLMLETNVDTSDQGFTSLVLLHWAAVLRNFAVQYHGLIAVWYNHAVPCYLPAEGIPVDGSKSGDTVLQMITDLLKVLEKSAGDTRWLERFACESAVHSGDQTSETTSSRPNSIIPLLQYSNLGFFRAPQGRVADVSKICASMEERGIALSLVFLEETSSVTVFFDTNAVSDGLAEEVAKDFYSRIDSDCNAARSTIVDPSSATRKLSKDPAEGGIPMRDFQGSSCVVRLIGATSSFAGAAAVSSPLKAAENSSSGPSALLADGREQQEQTAADGNYVETAERQIEKQSRLQAALLDPLTSRQTVGITPEVAQDPALHFACLIGIWRAGAAATYEESVRSADAVLLNSKCFLVAENETSSSINIDDELETTTSAGANGQRFLRIGAAFEGAVIDVANFDCNVLTHGTSSSARTRRNLQSKTGSSLFKFCNSNSLRDTSRTKDLLEREVSKAETSSRLQWFKELLRSSASEKSDSEPQGNIRQSVIVCQSFDAAWHLPMIYALQHDMDLTFVDLSIASNIELLRQELQREGSGLSNKFLIVPTGVFEDDLDLLAQLPIENLFVFQGQGEPVCEERCRVFHLLTGSSDEEGKEPKTRLHTLWGSLPAASLLHREILPPSSSTSSLMMKKANANDKESTSLGVPIPDEMSTSSSSSLWSNDASSSRLFPYRTGNLSYDKVALSGFVRISASASPTESVEFHWTAPKGLSFPASTFDHQQDTKHTHDDFARRAAQQQPRKLVSLDQGYSATTPNSSSQPSKSSLSAEDATNSISSTTTTTPCVLLTPSGLPLDVTQLQADHGNANAVFVVEKSRLLVYSDQSVLQQVPAFAKSVVEWRTMPEGRVEMNNKSGVEQQKQVEGRDSSPVHATGSRGPSGLLPTSSAVVLDVATANFYVNQQTRKILSHQVPQPVATLEKKHLQYTEWTRKQLEEASYLNPLKEVNQKSVLSLSLYFGVYPLLLACYSAGTTSTADTAAPALPPGLVSIACSTLGFGSGLLWRSHYLYRNFNPTVHVVLLFVVVFLGQGLLPVAVYMVPILLYLGWILCSLTAFPDWWRFLVSVLLFMPLLGIGEVGAASSSSTSSPEVAALCCYSLLPCMTAAASVARNIVRQDYPPGRFILLGVFLLFCGTASQGAGCLLYTLGTFSLLVALFPICWPASSATPSEESDEEIAVAAAGRIVDDSTTGKIRGRSLKEKIFSLSTDAFFNDPRPAAALFSFPVFYLYASVVAPEPLFGNFVFLGLWCAFIAPAVGWTVEHLVASLGLAENVDAGPEGRL
ncbi:unnamed protein product [Amoebophrya sp. A120]|nr:unnamed protein product [Amoebophrya sp. A120]|eukprot:GSA120T00003734001.1